MELPTHNVLSKPLIYGHMIVGKSGSWCSVSRCGIECLCVIMSGDWRGWNIHLCAQIQRL